MSIFREEAIEARKVSYGLGTVRAPFPKAFRALIVVSIVVAASFLATALALPYGRGMNAEGVITDRVLGDASARILVTEAMVGDIQPGKSAVVVFPALPNGQVNQFNGKVVDVSRVPEGGAGRDRYALRVVVPVAQRNNGKDIMPGMVVKVHLTTPKRRVYQWIYESIKA